MYVVYLTIYRGNKLPPFYIGYTSEKKILKGYGGSIVSKRYKEIWKQERKEHPELFKTTPLSFHESDIEARVKEEAFHRKLNVVNNPLYINLSIGSGRFGGCGENNPMYGVSRYGDKAPCFGKHPSKETIEKIRLANTGKPSPFKGIPNGKPAWNKGRPWPEEIKDKMKKPRTEEQKARMSKAQKGHQPWNKGIPCSESTKKKIGSANSRPHSLEHNRRISASCKVLPNPTVMCPHCNKIGKRNAMQRWHFDNCKSH